MKTTCQDPGREEVEVVVMEVEVVNKLGIERGEEGENRESAKKEDPPNSLKREEVKNNNDLGRRSPWWGGGRKEPAANNISRSCSHPSTAS